MCFKRAHTSIERDAAVAANIGADLPETFGKTIRTVPGSRAVYEYRMFTFCLCQAITWFWSPSAPTPQQRDKKTYKPGENGVTLHFFFFLSLRPSQRKTGNLQQGEARGNLVLRCLASWAGSSTSHHQPLPTCCTLAPRGEALLRMTTLFLSLLTAQFPMCANEQEIHTHKEKEITSLTSKIWNTHRVEDASNALVSCAACTTHSKNAGRSLVRSSSVTTVRWRRVQGNRNNHQRLKGKYMQGPLSPEKGEQGLNSYQRCCSWI